MRFFSTTCKRPRSQRCVVTSESLPVYRLWPEHCRAAAATWPSVFLLITIMTFLAGGRSCFPIRLQLPSWDSQVLVFSHLVVSQLFKLHWWLFAPCCFVFHRFSVSFLVFVLSSYCVYANISLAFFKHIRLLHCVVDVKTRRWYNPGRSSVSSEQVWKREVCLFVFLSAMLI